MVCYDYMNLKENIEKFKYERGLSDEEIFMYAFPQGIMNEDTKKLESKQIVVLLDNKNEFARIFIDGEEKFEVISPENNFFKDLNNRKISINEKDYI